MPQAFPRLFLLGLLFLAWAPPARAMDPALDPELAPLLQHLRARAARLHASGAPMPGDRSANPAQPNIYELQAGTGAFHTAGRVWMHMDNINYSPGNPFWTGGLSQDPSEQWPGNSSIEHLDFSSLWIGGKAPDGIRRVSAFDEIRGELADFGRTRKAYEGQSHGGRGRDDDGDQRVDEDYLNGKDDDGDGRVDEDFAAVSPDMIATEMFDNTPEAVLDGTATEPHVPLGLRVRRSSYAWSTPGGNNFVGVHYDVTNITRLVDGLGQDIDSVYLGMYFRTRVGSRANSNATQDDLTGLMEVAVNGVTRPSEIRDNPDHPERAAHEDSILKIMWSADDDGDADGRTPSAGAVVMLHSTVFPRLGFKRTLRPEDILNDEYGAAPRHSRLHAYRIFRSAGPYAQDGRPITDLERYDAMSNAAKSTTEFPDLDNTGIYRVLFSVGPYAPLARDSTITLDLAFCAGRLNYKGETEAKFPTTLEDLPLFVKKFGEGVPDPLFHSCQEAWSTYRGELVANPRALQTQTPPGPGEHTCGPTAGGGDLGRETCILGEEGRALSYADCRDEEGEQRVLSPQSCTWFDLDCDAATGVCNGSRVPLVDRKNWVGEAPPVPPRVKLVARDKSVEVLWDDLAEQSPDPGTLRQDFLGYRLYRAAGWKRNPDTGTTGPREELWELLGDWTLAGSPYGSGNVSDVRNSEVSDTALDRTADCTLPGGGACRVHPVGYYHFVDRQVVNGFRYFYTVTAYDQNSKPLGQRNGWLDSTLSQETGRSAIEEDRVIPRTDCAPDARSVKVVPNPYRFGAAWDLRGSSSDPTGTHVNFNHVPCGTFTLRIFTLSGDLVRTYTDRDARGSGTVEWDLITRNGQDVKGGIYLYSIQSSHGDAVGRFTLIR